MQMEVMMHKCPHKNFEGDLPFRGEAQNCETVKFLLVSPTYERGLELSLIRLRSPLNLGGVVVLQSLLPFMQCCNSKLISWISKFFPLHKQMWKKRRKQAQSAVPFAYKMRWYFKMNLRETFHLAELRTSRQGHPDYRRVAQGVYHEVKRVHPYFAEQMKFVDLKEYGLERMEAEKWTDKRMDEIQKKYGK